MAKVCWLVTEDLQMVPDASSPSPTGFIATNEWIGHDNLHRVGNFPWPELRKPLLFAAQFFTSHPRYLTVVCNCGEGSMEHIAEDRTLESLATYYAGITPASTQGTKVVAEDMWTLHI